MTLRYLFAILFGYGMIHPQYADNKDMNRLIKRLQGEQTKHHHSSQFKIVDIPQ